MALYPGKFQKVVIILSTGRTGTMGLAKLFDAGFPNVKGLHEPCPSRNLRIASNRYVCRRLGKGDMLRILTDSRARLLAQIQDPIYVESNWYLYGFIDVLRDVYGPNVRVLHVVRDPRTLIRSYLNFGTLRGMKGLAARYFPYWMLKIDNYDANAPTRFGRMSDAERLSWTWKTTNAEIDRAEELYGDGGYLRTRYEDVFAKDGRGIRRIVEWVGLKWEPTLLDLMRSEKVNASKDRGFPKFDEWHPAERQKLLDLCGPQMEKYGYLGAPQPVSAGV
jgi:hypothetical protein